jgi:4-hydroxybenzoate polyprenyltransferase
VTTNDIADEAIDRVNLSGDRRRPLVVGTGTRRELRIMAIASAGLALAGSALLTWPALVVTSCGLLISAGYSLAPVRIAKRGALASLILPACYVAVPFLLGVFSIQAGIRWKQIELLGALYLGFIGRIVLKDFRDLRGDAFFGKRTFLVRHGRRPTVLFSAVFTIAGTLGIVAVDSRSLTWIPLYLVLLAATLLVLKALAESDGHRRDERLISAFAILGRGTIMVLLMHLEMVNARSTGLRLVALGATFVVITLGQALSMARFGPRSNFTLPGQTTVSRSSLADSRSISVRR